MKILILLLACLLLASAQSKPKIITNTIVISGPFTEAEIKQFIDVMRAIERKHPENNYFAVIRTPGMSDKEHLELLERVFPRTKDRDRDTFIIPRP